MRISTIALALAAVLLSGALFAASAQFVQPYQFQPMPQPQAFPYYQAPMPQYRPPPPIPFAAPSVPVPQPTIVYGGSGPTFGFGH